MKKNYLASIGCLSIGGCGDYYQLKEFTKKREAIAWLKNYAKNDNKKNYLCDELDYCITVKNDCTADCVYSIVYKKNRGIKDWKKTWEK